MLGKVDKDFGSIDDCFRLSVVPIRGLCAEFLESRLACWRYPFCSGSALYIVGRYSRVPIPCLTCGHCDGRRSFLLVEDGMPDYVLNRNPQSNGDHQVHVKTCRRVPEEENRVPLGFHHTCQSALIAAKVRGYSNVNGCSWCSRECHLR
jgi:hypothetical protein